MAERNERFHEIARLAAEAAGRVANSTTDITPEAAAKAVADAYQAALNQLTTAETGSRPDMQARLTELDKSVTALLAKSREASALAEALNAAFRPAGGGRRR